MSRIDGRGDAEPHGGHHNEGQTRQESRTATHTAHNRTRMLGA